MPMPCPGIVCVLTTPLPLLHKVLYLRTLPTCSRDIKGAWHTQQKYGGGMGVRLSVGSLSYPLDVNADPTLLLLVGKGIVDYI